ncbi:DUF4839 domain-containing protein [Jatrophihabitans sp. YIM 134969]
MTGQKLDVAEDAIESAGGDPDKIKIIGGGALGVAVKSNWTVCNQVPAAGEALTSEPELTIERECTTASTSASVSSSSPASSPTPTAAGALTVANSPDLAALLQVGDGCDASVGAFASKYAGKQIEFDGSISSLMNHGDAKTRYDVLIAPGDEGVNSSRGPNLKFEDVNPTLDLNFEGPVPDSIVEGTKLHLVAEVGDYNSTQCLLFLTPVSTRAR